MLVEPNFPKYMPFTHVDSFTVLKFNIPTQDSLSQPPALSMTQSHIALMVPSLQASTCCPFTGLTFNINPLPTPQEVSFQHPCPSTSATMAAANDHFAVLILYNKFLGSFSLTQAGL